MPTVVMGNVPKKSQKIFIRHRAFLVVDRQGQVPYSHRGIADETKHLLLRIVNISKVWSVFPIWEQMLDGLSNQG